MAPKIDKATLLCLTGALVSVAAIVAHQSSEYTEPQGIRSRQDEAEQGRRWLDTCLKHADQLYIETRLDPEVFQSLVTFLRERSLVKDGRIVLVEEKLLIFLYICGQGASWRNAKYKCRHSLDSISVYFHEVLDRIVKLYPIVVKPPSSEVSRHIRDDPRRWPAFADCIGALDGTHIKIHVPLADQKRYRNRYELLSQNVLAVVDFDMNFTYILAGWEGSAHDGRVLKDAQDRGGVQAPPSKYYLADAGYSNSETLLCPYRGVRYHLREIGLVLKKPETREELFNFRHSSLRNVVERTFRIFKRRWRIFDRPHELSIQTQVKLVYALAAIHNQINRYSSMSEDFELLQPYADEEDELARRDAENRENLAISNRGMNERRENIADQLWERYTKRNRRAR